MRSLTCCQVITSAKEVMFSSASFYSFVWKQDYAQTTEMIFTKFVSWKITDFGGNLDHVTLFTIWLQL